MIPVLNGPITKLLPRWLLAFSCLYVAVPAPVTYAKEAPYSEKIYLSESEALQKVFGNLKVSTRKLTLNKAQRKALQKQLRRKLTEPYYTLYMGAKTPGGKPERYALILDEKGKHYPITFIVSLTPTAAVDKVAVMVYRERRGDGVKRRRFLRQFKGKDKSDAIEVNRDIVHITGSTISSWSIAAGVRKAVALLETLVV